MVKLWESEMVCWFTLNGDMDRGAERNFDGGRGAGQDLALEVLVLAQSNGGHVEVELTSGGVRNQPAF